MKKAEKYSDFLVAFVCFSAYRLFFVFTMDRSGTREIFLPKRLQSVHYLLSGSKTVLKPHFSPSRPV